MTAKIVICSLLVALTLAGDQGNGYSNQGSISTGINTLGSHTSSRLGGQSYSSGVSRNIIGGRSLGGKTALLGRTNRVLNNGGLRTLKNNNGYSSLGTSSNKAASFRSVGGGVSDVGYGNNGISGSHNIGTNRVIGLSSGKGLSRNNIHGSFGSNQVHDFSGSRGNTFSNNRFSKSGINSGTAGYGNQRGIDGSSGYGNNGLSNTHTVGSSDVGYGNTGISGTHQIGNQGVHSGNSFSRIQPIVKQDVHDNSGFSGDHSIGNQGSYDNNAISNVHSINTQRTGSTGGGYGNNGLSGSNINHNQGSLNSGYGGSSGVNSGQSLIRKNDLGNSIHSGNGLHSGISRVSGVIHSNNGLISSEGSRNVFNRQGNNIGYDNSGTHASVNQGNAGNSYSGDGGAGVHQIVNHNSHDNVLSGGHPTGNQHSLGSSDGYGNSGISNSHATQGIGSPDGYRNNGNSNSHLVHPAGGSSNFRLLNGHSIGNQGTLGGRSLRGSGSLLTTGSNIHPGSGVISRRGLGVNVLSVNSGIHNVGSVKGLGSGTYRNTGSNGITNVHGNTGNVHQGVSSLRGNVGPVAGYSVNDGNGHVGNIGQSNSFVGGRVGDVHQGNIAGGQGYSGSQSNFGNQGTDYNSVNNGVSRTIGASNGYNNNNVHGNNIGDVHSGSIGTVHDSGIDVHDNSIGNVNGGSINNVHANNIGNVHNNIGTEGYSSSNDVGNVHDNNLVGNSDSSISNVHNNRIGSINSGIHDNSVGVQGYSSNSHGSIGNVHNNNIGSVSDGSIGGQGYSSNRGNGIGTIRNSIGNVHRSGISNIGYSNRGVGNVHNNIGNIHSNIGGQSYSGSNGNNIGSIRNNIGNSHNSGINNNIGYSNRGVVGSGRIPGGFNRGVHGNVGQPRIIGSNTVKKNCFKNLDLGREFEFSDRAVNVPRKKIIRELQGRPDLRTKIGIEGAFVPQDFDVLIGFGSRKSSRIRRSVTDSFNGNSFFRSSNIFDLNADRKIDLQSGQLAKLNRLVKPNAEICPSTRRPLRSFNMEGKRCFTINRKDRPTMFASCSRHDCPECSRNRGVGRCVEEFEKTSVFAWCDGDSFSDNIREINLLVPSHCGGKSYDC